METMSFIDFGRQNTNCHIMNEGFMLLKITGNEKELPEFRGENGTNIFVHVLVLKGEIKIEWGNKLYPLSRNCFADFMDGSSLEIQDISDNAQAYILFFTAPFIASFMKKMPISKPSYVLRINVWPVFVMSEKAIDILQNRIYSLEEISTDRTHHFYNEMLNSSLRIYMMDIMNEYVKQEETSSALTETGRKAILFKQFVGLLIVHIRKEHTVGWYASQLCVTPQYLNRAIRNITKKTVYEHICIALTGNIIEQLENTEEPISQIADDFHFPDLATMTKFFKRQTGKTPSECRKAVTLL